MYIYIYIYVYILRIYIYIFGLSRLSPILFPPKTEAKFATNRPMDPFFHPPDAPRRHRCAQIGWSQITLAGSIRKNWKKNCFCENLYWLWLIASGAQRLRGWSPSACRAPRYSPDDPYHRLGPVHTCLYDRVRDTSDWDLFQRTGSSVMGQGGDWQSWVMGVIAQGIPKNCQGPRLVQSSPCPWEYHTSIKTLLSKTCNCGNEKTNSAHHFYAFLL